MSRRLVPAVLCAAFALLAVSAGPAAAVPPTCDPQQSSCNPEPIERTETANRKLTVTAAIGTVTSNPAGINCTASTCSTTKQVSRTCLEFDCNDWPAATGYTLTASGGPSGYSPSWSACAGNGTCTVFLGDEGTGADSRTVTMTWVDTTAPSTTFAPPAKVGPSNYNVSAGASDNSGAIAAYAWTVDSVAQGATGSVLSLSGVSNGTHSVSVRSRDAAGNWSGTVTKNVVVDKTVSSSLSALPGITSAATVPLTFTKDADVVKTECAMDGGAYAVCASGWSGISAATADGTHSYKVRATDDVGNVAESAAVSTTIDRTLPVLAFTDGPAEGQQVVTSNAAVTFSLVEARPNTVKCKLDAGAWNACTAGTPVQLVGLTDGTHVLSVQAVDLAGNSRTISRTFGVKVPTSGGGGETPTGARDADRRRDPDRRRRADPDRRRPGPVGRRHARDAVDPAGAGLQRPVHPRLRLRRQADEVHQPRHRRPAEDGQGHGRLQGRRLQGQEQDAQALRRQAERAQGAQVAQAQVGREAHDHGARRGQRPGDRSLRDPPGQAPDGHLPLRQGRRQARRLLAAGDEDAIRRRPPHWLRGSRRRDRR